MRAGPPTNSSGSASPPCQRRPRPTTNHTTHHGTRPAFNPAGATSRSRAQPALPGLPGRADGANVKGAPRTYAMSLRQTSKPPTGDALGLNGGTEKLGSDDDALLALGRRPTRRLVRPRPDLPRADRWVFEPVPVDNPDATCFSRELSELPGNVPFYECQSPGGCRRCAFPAHRTVDTGPRPPRCHGRAAGVLRVRRAGCARLGRNRATVARGASAGGLAHSRRETRRRESYDTWLNRIALQLSVTARAEDELYRRLGRPARAAPRDHGWVCRRRGTRRGVVSTRLLRPGPKTLSGWG